MNALARLALAALALAAVAGAAQAGTAAPAPSLLPIAMALLAVLALIPLAVWLLKRFGGGSAMPAAGLQVVGALTIGPGQRVVVVQAGERWLMLGVTAGSITRLGTLARRPADVAAPDSTAPASFAALLARVARGGPPQA